MKEDDRRLSNKGIFCGEYAREKWLDPKMLG